MINAFSKSLETLSPYKGYKYLSVLSSYIFRLAAAERIQFDLNGFVARLVGSFRSQVQLRVLLFSSPKNIVIFTYVNNFLCSDY